jgi:murein L,D-transpeptidase YafK
MAIRFHRHASLALALAWLLVATFATTSRASPTSVTRLHVSRMHLTKSTHTLTLLDGDTVVASYVASLGPGGAGAKRQEGDNVTPVGRYHVVSHSPSQYRIFLRLDYPNRDDRARFAALKASGELPKSATIGGDIGIHGTPQERKYDAERASFRGVDWTAGCVGVQDDEIDQIAASVADGTVIDIED